MKFLLDVHIPYKLIKVLNELEHEAIHVNNILDKWFTKDSDICRYADENDLIVITKDADFRKSYFLKNTPKKLIKINLGNISTEILIDLIKKNIKQIEDGFSIESNYIEIGKDIITVFKSYK